MYVDKYLDCSEISIRTKFNENIFILHTYIRSQITEFAKPVSG